MMDCDRVRVPDGDCVIVILDDRVCACDRVSEGEALCEAEEDVVPLIDAELDCELVTEGVAG